MSETPTDRVELTNAEYDQLSDALKLEPPTPGAPMYYVGGIDGVVASIVAARVQALQAKLDGRGASQEFVMRFSEAEFERLQTELAAANASTIEAQKDATYNLNRWRSALAERDAARAELAAANADRDWEEAQKNALRKAADKHIAALQATLDRVTALADEWEAAEIGIPSPDTALSGNECAADLRAALTPEGKP